MNHPTPRIPPPPIPRPVRSRLLPALRTRRQAVTEALAALPSPDPETEPTAPTTPHPHPEEALRIALVRHYRRLESGRWEPGEVEGLLERLSALDRPALGPDWRFLDAHHLAWELLAPRFQAAPPPPAWLAFLPRYATLLQRWEEALEGDRPAPEEPPPYPDEPAASAPPEPPQPPPPQPLRVLALCESLYHLPPLWRTLGHLPGIHLSLLVLDNPPHGPVGFWARHLYQALRRITPGDLLLLIRLLSRGRLHLIPRLPDHPRVTAWLHGNRFDIGLHKLGIIYRPPMIDAFTLGIINPHIGLLPPVRGYCSMEWSLFHGLPTGTSAFFIDSGIDTGPRLILWREEPVPGRFPTLAEAKAHLFSRDLEVFRLALLHLRDGHPLGHNDTSRGRRYYPISALSGAVVAELLGEAASSAHQG